MKVKHITQYLFESYKDAKEKFSQEAPEGEVKQYLDTFKELGKKGIATGQEKDIGYWIKQGWDNFKDFVDSKSQQKTKSQVKKSKKSDSIIAHEDNNNIVVIPLSKGASCYYGKNTKWCTASTQDKNYFSEYFYVNKVVLFYIFKKKSGKKYAAAYSEKVDDFEFFDEMDKSISLRQFKKNTSIDDENLKTWFKEFKSIIHKSMDIDNAPNEDIVDIIKYDFNIFYNLENVSNDLIHNISQDEETTFRLIYNSCTSNKLDLLWEKINSANKKDIFKFIDNYLVYSGKIMSNHNIKSNCIENLFFQNFSETMVLEYINQVKDNEEFNKNEYIRNLIWKIGFDYVSDKESYLEDSLYNNTIRLLMYLISNDLITEKMINILKSHFSDLSIMISKHQLENILQLIGSETINFENLIKYKIINENNIEYIIKLNIENSFIMSKDHNKTFAKKIKDMNVNSINIEFNDKMLNNIENNLDNYLPLLKLLDEIPHDAKLSMVKYIINNIIFGKNNKLSYERKLEVISSTILDRPQEILNGLLYPMSEELINDIKDYLKTI